MRAPIEPVKTPRRSAKRTLFALTLIGATLIPSGCETTTDLSETDGARLFCTVARPITWASADTDQTIREVKAHNAVGARLCGWAAGSDQ